MPVQPYKIVLHSVTGVLSRWILPLNSKAPIFSQVMSNGYLTAAAVQPHARKKTVYGIGDEQGEFAQRALKLPFRFPVGAFRLFYLKQISAGYTVSLSQAMHAFMQREVVRKRRFLEWQAAFNERNERRLVQRRQKEEVATAQEAAPKEAKRTELAKVVEKPLRKGPIQGKVFCHTTTLPC